MVKSNLLFIDPFKGLNGVFKSEKNFDFKWPDINFGTDLKKNKGTAKRGITQIVILLPDFKESLLKRYEQNFTESFYVLSCFPYHFTFEMLNEGSKLTILAEKNFEALVHKVRVK